MRLAAEEVLVLRAFFATLVGAGLARRNPFDRLASPSRTPRRAPVLLSRDAVALLLATSSGESRSPREELRRPLALRARACLELLYGLGLRASEAAAIRLTDLDLAEGTLVVQPAKRGPRRALPVPKSALPHVERYLNEGRPVLQARGGGDEGRLLLTTRGAPLDRQSVYRIVVSVVERVGVKAHTHAFRRAVATHLVEEGVSVVVVKELLGHKSLAVTALYVEVMPSELHRAVETLDRVHGWRADTKLDDTAPP